MSLQQEANRLAEWDHAESCRRMSHEGFRGHGLDPEPEWLTRHNREAAAAWEFLNMAGGAADA